MDDKKADFGNLLKIFHRIEASNDLNDDDEDFLLRRFEKNHNQLFNDQLNRKKLVVHSKNHFDQINSIYKFVHKTTKYGQNNLKNIKKKQELIKPQNFFNCSNLKKAYNISLSPKKTTTKSSVISTKLSPCKPVIIRKNKSLLEEFMLNARECNSSQYNNLNKHKETETLDEEKCFLNKKLEEKYIVNPTKIRDIYRRYNTNFSNNNSFTKMICNPNLNLKNEDTKNFIKDAQKNKSHSIYKISRTLQNDFNEKSPPSKSNKIDRLNTSWNHNKIKHNSKSFEQPILLKNFNNTFFPQIRQFK